MIRLLIYTFVQAMLGVGGIAMLTRALHGKPMELRVMTLALFTIEGGIGALLLFASFLVMSAILSFAKMAVYIPVNTAVTFLLTVVISIALGHERISVALVLGMVLIVAGVAIITGNRN